MVFLDNIRAFIANLDQKTWYTYVAIAMGIYLVLIAGVLYYYYSSISTLQEQINNVNDERKQAQQILTEAKRVQKQRAEVNAIIEEDPNFKIKGYLLEVMAGIGITPSLSTDQKISREDNFVENIATYQFTGITMKQLTELLDEIEQNKRLYTKDLEIIRSKKIPNTIDVGITVATMIPKERS